MSFLNFKAFRALGALNASKFKKLVDALLTASDAVNVTSSKSSYHCLHKICFNTLNLRCTYVSIFYFKKKIKTFPPLASRDIIIFMTSLIYDADPFFNSKIILIIRTYSNSPNTHISVHSRLKYFYYE